MSASLSLIVPMSAQDLIDLDAWLSEHDHNDQASRDAIIRNLIMDQVYS